MSNIEEIRVPELGENISSAEVSSILVSEGQAIEKDDALIEVESDKASLEIPSTLSGTVTRILVKSGQKIGIGEAIVELSVGAPSAQKTDAEPAAKPAAALPDEAPKSGPEKTAPKSDIPAAVNDKTEQKPQAVAYAKGGAPVPLSAPKKPELGTPVAAGPSVHRLARELGVDLHKVSGTGPRGRILKEDVKNYVKKLVERRKDAGPGAPELPDFSAFGPVRHEKMSGIRRKIAERMAFAASHIPHVTQFDEVDITSVERFRQARSREAQRRGQKLTVTVLILKVLALAMKRFPIFNTSVDLKHDEIIYKDYVNIGVAVDTDKGLLVPVIQDADKKGIWQLAAELNDLAGRSRERKIKPDELQGGNISLTNLGGLGTTHFTPIINWPDVAVLGVGRAKERAIRIDGEWQPRMILPLSVSYDHRIIDGADAARFLRWICEALENPLHILMD